MGLEGWERWTYWPLNLASVAFLIAYSARVISNAEGSAWTLLTAILLAVWVAFVVHFFVSLVLARPRAPWFRKNGWGLIFVVVPALQPVRLLRLVPVVTGRQRVRGTPLRVRLATYVGGTLLLVLYLGALMVLDFEQNAPGASIRSFGDAIWWAVVTITTVGYGDYVPITIFGRLVAVALMVSGVALIGTVTGTLASYLSDRARADDPARRPSSQSDIETLERQVQELSTLLEQRGGRDGGTP